MVRPAVVVTARRVLTHEPRVVHVVPLTTFIRDWASEATVPAETVPGIGRDSAAQCQHLRAVSTARVVAEVDNVGPVLLRPIRETISALLDL